MKELNTAKKKTIIKRCHCCGQVSETHTEIQKCLKCNKSFLPLNYFSKVHGSNDAEYNALFSESWELQEDDLVKGLYVLW